jgi:hypothetical protein
LVAFDCVANERRFLVLVRRACGRWGIEGRQQLRHGLSKLAQVAGQPALVKSIRQKPELGARGELAVGLGGFFSPGIECGRYPSYPLVLRSRPANLRERALGWFHLGITLGRRLPNSRQARHTKCKFVKTINRRLPV